MASNWNKAVHVSECFWPPCLPSVSNRIYCRRHRPPWSMWIHDYENIKPCNVCLSPTSWVRVEHAIPPTRNDIILNLTPVCAASKFPGGDHNAAHVRIQIRSFLFDRFVHTVHSPCINWPSLRSLVHQLDWGRFFLETYSRRLEMNFIQKWPAALTNKWPQTRIVTLPLETKVCQIEKAVPIDTSII